MRGKSLLAVLFVSLSPGPLVGQDAVASSREACDAGDMLSCDDLGSIYEAGVAVTQDLARAASLFQQACDGGALLGCSHLGGLFQNGQGVGRDLVTAVFLYERACSGGEMLGCHNLGVSHEHGDGVTQDPTLAVSFYEQACGGGEMLSCSNLGGMYRTGTGVAEDLGAAASLYWRACEGRVLPACINLAISYERGDGVPRDLATAVTLYQQACELGVTSACNRIGVTVLPEATALGGTNQPGAGDSADGSSRSGWVVDTATRDPLSEAIVDVLDLGLRVITDASGRVEFENLPHGRHRLRVERVGYVVMEGDLDVPGDREFLLPLDRTTLGDLGAPGQIVGRVLEGGREYGVSAVDITVLTPTPVRTLSDPRGRFDVTDVQPGLVDVRFERLGYAPRMATVIVQPDKTVEISASMSARPIELELIKVVVRSRTLEANGFYRRALTDWGKQLTREDMIAVNPTFVSDVFRRIPGVKVSHQGIIGDDAVLLGRLGCTMRIFLDGIRMLEWDFDSIPPEYLEAMEVYQGLGTPIQYATGPGCGAVLLWTGGG